MEISTESIKISKTIKSRLDKLKDYPRETYNDVIEKLIKELENAKRI